MNNDNPLSGAEDWCAVEGTDSVIFWAYYEKRHRDWIKNLMTFDEYFTRPVPPDAKYNA